MWKPHLVWFGGTIDQRPDFPPQSENLSSCCSPIKAWSGQELQMWGGGEAPGRRMMEVMEHRRLSYHIRAFLMPVLTPNLQYYFRKTSVPQKKLFKIFIPIWRRWMYGEEFTEGEAVQEEGEELLWEAVGKHCWVVVAIDLNSQIESLGWHFFGLPQFLYHSGKGRLFGIGQRQNRLNYLTSTCK